MKSKLSKAFIFGCKSLFWAGVLYAACIVVLYKDDIANQVDRNATIAVKLQSAIPALTQINDTIITVPASHTGIALALPGEVKSIEVDIEKIVHIISKIR